ncbi:MAG: hypothetical protein RL757_2825 [Bacteroidota bacterium]|jgi:putative ABC transport system permease protein
MKLSEIIKMSWQSVRGNKLRSGLTMTIIAVGIMALVGILTALDCALFALNDSFNSLGSNSFSIERKRTARKRGRGMPSMRVGNPISYAEAADFKRRFDFPARVTIAFDATSGATVAKGDKKSNPVFSITGVDENYAAVRGQEIEFGRYFSESELNAGVAHAIVGSELVKLLFNGEPSKAIGETVLVGNLPYQVIGILKSKGSGGSGSGDKIVWVPVQNALQNYNLGGRDLTINVGVSSAPDLEAASNHAEGVFRQVRHLHVTDASDFEVVKSTGLLDFLTENTSTIRGATVLIGLITLIGSAIGLMNIMLVSVTERTREIGISKALGATSRTILLQFLTEAIMICQLGGFVGIVLGILMGNLVSLGLGGSFVVPWAWILLGVLTCLVVGLISGIYPASRAAKLDPIESLRYE